MSIHAKMPPFNLLSAACLLSALGTVHAEDDLIRFQEVRPGMGSTFEIIFFSSDEARAKAAMEAAFSRIAALNQVFSDYDSQSEANQLSHAAPMERPAPVGEDMWQVLCRSQAFNRRSNGAFDITVGPLTRLWRRARRRSELPDEDRLEEALAAVGFNHVRLDERKHTIQLLTEDMRLDFGGIAKGYAADAALAELRAQGITRALVNAGGDVALGDPPPGQTGWRVGVAPLEADRAPSRYLRLHNCAIATSGDMWQYVEIDGQRYSHIVDPRTGLGLTLRSSVTVVASDCMTADAMASAVSVMGPKEGTRLVEKMCTTECLVAYLRNAEVQTQSTGGFDDFFEEANGGDR